MAQKIIKQLRDFPSVEEILQADEIQQIISYIPRPAVVMVVRQVIGKLKEQFHDDNKEIPLSTLYKKVAVKIRLEKRKEVSKVINATGIVVHTNLGRAPLSEEALQAMVILSLT